MNTSFERSKQTTDEWYTPNSIDTVLYDPPYSPRQVSECYKKIRDNSKYANYSGFILE